MLKNPAEKYIPFVPIQMERRTWPDKQITAPPVWCSVDLRDGNQALIDPMNVEEKLELFHTLVDIGVKEIEVGFPSASETEFQFFRTLIEGGHIPDDVTIQMLVQARPHLIQRTFEAMAGAKNVILHFYNSTSTLQRKVVFHTDMEGVTQIAVDAARLIRALSEPIIRSGTNLRYQYSPESFMGTEMDNAVYICQRVLEELGATPENKVILNLPSTVENCMPNYFADEIEYFINKLPSRDCAVISLHPHNDRGEGVATAELGMLAGAERIEATLFGNGERTGNVDMITLAMNMYTQGVDPGLDFSDINRIRTVYERCTKMKVGERQPYAGELVFTAFSGSHQDAINKGVQYRKENRSPLWEIPYLPIDPADVGRQYEPIIRINSQSGKGGAAFVMQQSFGYDLPKAMHAEFGHIVQVETDRVGTELQPQRIFELFQHAYVDISSPYTLLRHAFQETADAQGRSHVVFRGTLRHKETVFEVCGEGNGPIDAFFNAIHGQKMDRFTFVDYKEHAIQAGSDSMAVAYIQLRDAQGQDIFGVGVDHNINLAPLRGILSAINRAVTAKQ
ncbi:MAG: 2-isopropylmalate synthase [Clostridiales bacterium]|uniref:2-isopropylmalate synthase n=1 Tax=Intestinimonas TaxID=1392389 RepID=UPI0006BF5021|nr:MULTISPECIES: 2-isopropylmalate synthase [Intestinimonas]MDU1323575.1 2-isopropylmalate synthase [Clostridiales bacterium]CUQ14438.1 2-isopropylmalate synthase LeuA [Flavonifractor plautii]SCJ15384.1 2-isopropylmalate synthase [uncultured Flavonifractor sp.]BDE87777.1 2-isopropylmalate synthase [Oscillospiraceae bacterium]MCI5562797.1 2-isopropylmalate synthase [Intestinimonas massiliensis (ex Afouda et al. 2020)]